MPTTAIGTDVEIGSLENTGGAHGMSCGPGDKHPDSKVQVSPPHSVAAAAECPASRLTELNDELEMAITARDWRTVQHL
eukprot:12405993-Karenia_brevis.AAC.1